MKQLFYLIALILYACNCFATSQSDVNIKIPNTISYAEVKIIDSNSQFLSLLYNSSIDTKAFDSFQENILISLLPWKNDNSVNKIPINEKNNYVYNGKILYTQYSWKLDFESPKLIEQNEPIELVKEIFKGFKVSKINQSDTQFSFQKNVFFGVKLKYNLSWLDITDSINEIIVTSDSYNQVYKSENHEEVYVLYSYDFNLVAHWCTNILIHTKDENKNSVFFLLQYVAPTNSTFYKSEITNQNRGLIKNFRSLVYSINNL